MSFWKDIEPFIEPLRRYKKGRTYADPDTNRLMLAFYKKHINSSYRGNAGCRNCLKTIYGVMIAEYERRPRRGKKKKL